MSIHVLISILILICGLIVGMPIPFAFGGSFLWLTYMLDFNSKTLLSSGYTQINSTILLAIPLFVLAGKVMEKGHIGDALIGLVQRFVGRFKSGLGAVAVITSAVFGSISGSASARPAKGISSARMSKTEMVFFIAVSRLSLLLL